MIHNAFPEFPDETVIQNLLTLARILHAMLRFLLWRTMGGVRCKSGYIHIENDSIHFTRYGEGAPLILLHGGLSRPLSWFAQVPVLVQQGFQLILISTRGHGRSTGIGGHEYALYAADVAAVMESLKLTSAHLLGWSDGANTALEMALRWPQKIRRMILISANYHYSGQSMVPVETSPHSWLKRVWTSSGSRFPALQQQLSSLWNTQPVLTVSDLSRIDLPALIITGQFDCIDQQHSRQMADALPQGKPAVIAGAAHAAPVTHAHQVNALILNFLTETPS